MELQAIKQRAKATAESRGHVLKPWLIIETDDMGMAETKCKHCGCWLNANTNGSIKGSAVVMQCSMAKVVA